MEILHGYRDNKELRQSFNELAEKIFGLNFENWYGNGFWKDNYDPYSVVEDGKVVANVSINKCDMNCDGKVAHLFQLGTVMTDPEYRGKGYARKIMERILDELEEKADGIYLFGNDSVVDFYPKFGFKERKEYRYSKAVCNDSDCRAELVPMSSKEDWEKMCRILDSKEQNSKIYMVGNTGLYMFYLSQFMQENTFYIADIDSYAIAEIEDDTLILHAIIGDGDIDAVIVAFGKDIKKAVLAFTPKNTEGFEKNELIIEDTHFFVHGRFFDETAPAEFMFQEITHA